MITDYEGGLPPIEEQPIDCGEGGEGTLPEGEQPCLDPTPAPDGHPAPHAPTVHVPVERGVRAGPYIGAGDAAPCYPSRR